MRASFNSETTDIDLEGHSVGPIQMDGHGCYFCPLEWLQEVEAASLQQALKAAIEFFGTESVSGSDTEIVLSLTTCEAPEIYFDHSGSAADSIGFGLDSSGTLTLEVDVFVEDHTAIEDGVDPRLEIPRILKPMLQSEGVAFEQGWDDSSPGSPVAPPFVYHLELRPESLDQRTVGDLRSIGERAQALLESFASTAPLQNLVDHLRAGRAAMLLGQPETETFDAKRELYQQTPDGKVDLALDVARFANASGGVILLGVSTKKVGASDVVHAFPPQDPVDPKAIQSYKSTIDAWVYPLVDGIEIDTCPGPNGDLLMIIVPKQKADMKPFLVHGTLREGRHDGRFFSIPIRRGEDSVHTRPEEIQRLLRPGFD